MSVLLHPRINEFRLSIILIRLWYRAAPAVVVLCGRQPAGWIGSVYTLSNSSETFPR